MKHLFFLLTLLFCLPLAAQQTYRAQVVDAETGEALPYVNIYVAAGRGTMTNSKGYFIIEAEPTEQLSFRYVGYETMQVDAAALSGVVRMKPYTRELAEVVVTPIHAHDILRQVISRLDAEYRKHKKAQQVYFFRSVLENKVGAYMLEAFLRARDAVNARDEILLSGVRGTERRGAGYFPSLNITNIQRHIETGPKTFGSTFWEKAVKPLDSFSRAKRYYAFDSSILRGEDGKTIYCIDCTWTHEMTHALRNTRYITGKLYVEADTYRMLRFDGRVNNAYQWVDLDRLPADIRFHITYDHSRGYTSMAHLAVEGGNAQMRYHSIAFAVEGYDNVRKKQKSGSSNLVIAIEETACDSTLWTEEIVRRTEEEERIFKNGMESLSAP